MMCGFLETCTLTDSKEELFRGLNVNLMFCGSECKTLTPCLFSSCVISVTYEVSFALLHREKQGIVSQSRCDLIT